MLNKKEIELCCAIADKVTADYTGSRKRSLFCFAAMLAAQRAADYSIEAYGLVVPQVVEQNVRLEMKTRFQRVMRAGVRSPVPPNT